MFTLTLSNMEYQCNTRPLCKQALVCQNVYMGFQFFFISSKSIYLNIVYFSFLLSCILYNCFTQDIIPHNYTNCIYIKVINDFLKK